MSFDPHMGHIYASLVSSRDEIRINVHQHPGNENLSPFPVVDIGRFSWQPTVEQMTELRDKITEYLGSKAPGVAA